MSGVGDICFLLEKTSFQNGLSTQKNKQDVTKLFSFGEKNLPSVSSCLKKPKAYLGR